METKKNPNLDLEKKRNIFFFMGLTIALGLSITAFEWKTYGEFEPVHKWEIEGDFDEDNEIMITKHKEPKPPKPRVLQKIIEVNEDTDDDLNDLVIDMELTDYIPEIEIPEPEKEPEEKVWTGIVEDEPTPVGGYESFYKFVSKELNYPAKARKMGVEGRVFLQFIIDKKGNIKDVQVIKGIGAGCDEEAERVMSMAPKWNPGKQRGRPVMVKMVLPIVFRLN